MILAEAALDEGLARLERARSWSPRLVSRLEGLIRSGTDAELFRINPLAFAAGHGAGSAEAIDLFVHAAAVGLFRTDWILICPNCACAIASLVRLGPIDPTYHCPVCHQDTEAVLDEFIAVYFTVDAGIREIAHHRPHGLAPRDYLMIGRGVREGRLPDGTVYVEFVDQALRAIEFLEPGRTTLLEVDAQPGFLQGFSTDADAGFAFAVETGAAPAGHIEMRYLGDRLEHERGPVAPGRITFAIHNPTPCRHLFAVIQLPPGFDHPHLVFDSFLTGQQLLMTQSFRDLFRADAAGRAEGIAIRSIALLFTDLQGSTALYQQVGDLNALQIVQEHFGRLREVAGGHGGCVVKTIGDAIMAAFPSPRHAVEATLAMLRSTAQAGRHHAGAPLLLKAGVHFGAAVAVTFNDQLDYFGQTVNAAARVQSLARAGEIVVSDEVLTAEGVADAIGGLPVETETARVRGFAEPITVHRLRPGT